MRSPCRCASCAESSSSAFAVAADGGDHESRDDRRGPPRAKVSDADGQPSATPRPTRRLQLGAGSRTPYATERWTESTSARASSRSRRAPGPDNPPCPACGEPLFGWLDAAAGPGRAGAPLRELRPRRRRRAGRAGGGAARARPARRRRARSGSSTGPASPARSAAPAGPASSRAPRYLFTVEAVRRLVAHRDQVVHGAPLGARRRPRRDLADAAQQRHLRPQRRARRRSAAAARRRRRGPGSAGSTPLTSVVARDPGAARSPSRSSWPPRALPPRRGDLAALRTALRPALRRGLRGPRGPASRPRGRGRGSRRGPASPAGRRCR